MQVLTIRCVALEKFSEHYVMDVWLN